MRLPGVLMLAGLAGFTAADAAAQPGAVPPGQSAAMPAQRTPPAAPGAPLAPDGLTGWGGPVPLPPPPDVTGAEGETSPTAAGVMAVLATVVPVGVGLTMTALVERNEGEATLAGLVVGGTGLVVGPSVGHFYAGEVGHGMATLGLRTLAFGNMTGMGFLGAVAMFGSHDDSAFGWMAFGLAAISGAGGLGLVVYDLVDAPSAARRANREDQSTGRAEGLAPRVTLGPAGGVLTWTF